MALAEDRGGVRKGRVSGHFGEREYDTTESDAIYSIDPDRSRPFEQKLYDRFHPTENTLAVTTGSVFAAYSRELSIPGAAVPQTPELPWHSAGAPAIRLPCTVIRSSYTSGVSFCVSQSVLRPATVAASRVMIFWNCL
ncbi:hypothetical protein E2C01_077239 [Portunus trituberculatus]|uniref:Uncharacterized protein n=1 Tax=Portunus trituberculatus TaxID=210409 RepID=A0A5B7ILH8_PORTR|nr:hypothetical protein [Portunus trituberculatus]